MMSLRKPIVVAGGGVGGLTAALALHRHDLPVVVYERRTAEEIRTAPGSGLTIWSNGSTALGWLGLAEPLLAAAAVVTGLHFQRSDGGTRFRMAVQRHNWPAALPSLSIGRMDLAEILMDACADRGVPVHYGTRVAGFTTTATATATATGAGVEVELAGGGRVEAAALIGADGLRSPVHTALHGEVPAAYLGRSVYRAVVPGTEGLPEGVPVLYYDAATGIGGGVYRIGGHRSAWTLSFLTEPGRHEPAGRELAHAMQIARVLPAPIRDRVAGTDPAALIRTDIWYHRWHEGWGVGPVTLLGDAAHAMPNDLGQGGCQAIEDALVLADALAGGDLSTTDGVAAALRCYENRRYPRARWVHDQSVRVATVPGPANPVLRWVMGQLVRLYMSLAEKSMWHTMLRPPELGVRPQVAGRSVGGGGA